MTTEQPALFRLGKPNMRISLAAAILTALVQSALAQQQPDIPMLQKAVTVIQAQRNQALDAQAGAEVRAATLAEENARLKAQIAEMEKTAPVAPVKPAE